MQTKETQGKLWSTSPADWSRFIEPSFLPIYDAVLGSVKLDEGSLMLDAGCGSGLFLGMAASRGADVYGVDAAPGLLAVAKKRLPKANLLIEDLETLPFPDETFDVVTAFNSLQYAGSFANALAEVSRVTKKNGRVAIAFWGREEDCEAGVLLKAVGSLLPPPPPGTPGPFALSEDGKVEGLLKAAGLKLVDKQTVFCPWLFVGEKDLHSAYLCTAPCAKAAEAVGEHKVRETLTQSGEAFRLGGDVYYFRNHFIVFVAEKP